MFQLRSNWQTKQQRTAKAAAMCFNQPKRIGFSNYYRLMRSCSVKMPSGLTLVTRNFNEDASGQPVDPTRPGLARELAQINLTLGFYTQWYWKIDLHNLMHFLSLRADPNAQYEIRAYAEVILDTVKRWVPMTYDAFLEYRMNAATISATALAVIRRLLAGEAVSSGGQRPLAPRMARADGGPRPVGLIRFRNILLIA